MIGLVDFDFQSQTKLNPDPPNIEIMKLANYYRTEENKFSMLVNLNTDNFRYQFNSNHDKLLHYCYYMALKEKESIEQSNPKIRKRIPNVIDTFHSNR